MTCVSGARGWVRGWRGRRRWCWRWGRGRGWAGRCWPTRHPASRPSGGAGTAALVLALGAGTGLAVPLLANSAPGFKAFVGGGDGNVAGGSYSFIGGGQQNNIGASDYAASVAGGFDNITNAPYTTVAGGA